MKRDMLEYKGRWALTEWSLTYHATIDRGVVDSTNSKHAVMHIRVTDKCEAAKLSLVVSSVECDLGRDWIAVCCLSTGIAIGKMSNGYGRFG